MKEGGVTRASISQRPPVKSSDRGSRCEAIHYSRHVGAMGAGEGGDGGETK